MRTQLSPLGENDELKFELSTKALARIDYKSHKDAGTIDEPVVGKKTSAKKVRHDNKRDQFVVIDDVELVFSYDNDVSNKLNANKLCKKTYKKNVITLALVKRLWNDLKSGKMTVYYNCVTGELES